MIHFEQNKRKQHYKEVNKNFLDSTITVPELTELSYLNPSVLLMLCYGLLVYPFEFWNKDIDYSKLQDEVIRASKDSNVLLENIFELFYIKRIKKKDIRVLLISVRNAISHGRVNFDIKENKFIFYDMYKKNKHFEASISMENLGVFLTGIGKFFIHQGR